METEQIFNEENEKNTDVVKCPCCGSNMFFVIEKQIICCEHCGTEIDFNKDHNIIKRDWDKRDCNHDDWSSETYVVQCNNCGSRENVMKAQIAVNCPFCGTTNVVKIDELPGIKPMAVYPFTVSKEDSIKSAQKWLRKKWVVPSDCKKSVCLENVNGVYLPAWIFNIETTTNYELSISRDCKMAKLKSKKKKVEFKDGSFSISGVYEKSFNDIVMIASKKIKQKMFNKIQPFEDDKAVVYDKKYLSGFVADHYEKGIDESFDLVKRMMHDEIKNKVEKKYRLYDIWSTNLNTNHKNVKFKYVLLPVWVGNYKYKNKNYKYFINGNNNKVYGETPVSKVKSAMTIGVRLVAFLSFFISMFLIINGM